MSHDALPPDARYAICRVVRLDATRVGRVQSDMDDPWLSREHAFELVLKGGDVANACISLSEMRQIRPLSGAVLPTCPPIRPVGCTQSCRTPP